MTWEGRVVTRRIWKEEVAEQDITHRNKEKGKDCRRLPQQRRKVTGLWKISLWKLRTVKCQKCHQDRKPRGSDAREERGVIKRGAKRKNRKSWIKQGTTTHCVSSCIVSGSVEMIFKSSRLALELYVFSKYSNVLVSAAAGNKSATWPPLPPPACGGEWKERGRNWWVGIRAV